METKLVNIPNAKKEKEYLKSIKKYIEEKYPNVTVMQLKCSSIDGAEWNYTASWTKRIADEDKTGEAHNLYKVAE